ncbi:unnamed protein product, partial [Ectocarpus sp. 12 AP-2014]
PSPPRCHAAVVVMLSRRPDARQQSTPPCSPTAVAHASGQCDRAVITRGPAVIYCCRVRSRWYRPAITTPPVPANGMKRLRSWGTPVGRAWGGCRGLRISVSRCCRYGVGGRRAAELRVAPLLVGGRAVADRRRSAKHVFCCCRCCRGGGRRGSEACHPPPREKHRRVRGGSSRGRSCWPSSSSSACRPCRWYHRGCRRRASCISCLDRGHHTTTLSSLGGRHTRDRP